MTIAKTGGGGTMTGTTINLDATGSTNSIVLQANIQPANPNLTVTWTSTGSNRPFQLSSTTGQTITVTAQNAGSAVRQGTITVSAPGVPDVTLTVIVNPTVANVLTGNTPISKYPTAQKNTKNDSKLNIKR